MVYTLECFQNYVQLHIWGKNFFDQKNYIHSGFKKKYLEYSKEEEE